MTDPRCARAIERIHVDVSWLATPDATTFSFYIHRLAAWLQHCGVEVDLQASLPGDVLGRYDDTIPSICMDADLSSAEAALIVLAHEAGHWLGYRMFKPKNHGYQRERQAFVYGWRVLELVGAAGVLVSRATWIREGR